MRRKADMGRHEGLRPLRCGVLGVCLALCAVTVAATPRVIAVGDVHGADSNLRDILQAVGLIDAEASWVGGDAVLIQMGDLLDRGRDVRQVMDLLMRLQSEAAAAGGRVEVLLGNHEAMNLLGIRRDVNAEAYAAFVAEDSESRLSDAWDVYAKFQTTRALAAGRPVPEFGDADREAWIAAHPLGWIEYVEALAPDGPYGEWLRERPVAVVAEDVLFVHGGISPEVQGMGPDALNRRFAEELETWDEVFQYMVDQRLVLPWASVQDAASMASMALQARSGTLHSVESRFLRRHAFRVGRLRGLSDWFLLSKNGPLWFRGPAVWDEIDDAELVDELLDGLGVSRIVIAHSTRADGRIATRFDDRVVLVDTGMLGPPYYPHGRPAALEIAGGGMAAVYRGAREVLVPPATVTEEVAFDALQPHLDMVAGPPTTGSEVEPNPQWGGYVWRDIHGDPLPFQDEPGLLHVLRRGEVVSTESLGGTTQPLKVVLEDSDSGVRVNAIFRHVDEDVRSASGLRSIERFRLRDRAVHELAAYRIDRMLGIRRVPPVVLRTIDGRDGTLQLWLEDVQRELDRREDGVDPPDSVSWARQLAIMHVFDNLIGNFDRNQTNVLYDTNWRMWLIDHTRSFLRANRLLEPEKIQRCDRQLLRSLRDLDEDVVRRRLAVLVDPPEVDALFARRDALAARFDSLINERGEDAVLFDLHGPALDADTLFDELEQILEETGPVVLPPEEE